MKTKSLGFIGGGRITKIFLQAFEKSGIQFDKIIVSDTNQDVLNSLKKSFPHITVVKENLQEVLKNEVVFIALHPPVLMDTLAKIKGSLSNDTILVSLAPKHTIEKMTSALDGFANIARMNPSASSIVQKGVNPVAFSERMTTEFKNKFLELVNPLGFTPIVVEPKIEAYAVIGAMGHTYFFFQIQKLKELAVTFGMDEKEAQAAISRMLLGTTETLFNAGLTYSEVADLIPVKPMAEAEDTIKGYYDQYLTGIFNKIKP